MTTGGPFGSLACSSWRIHCSRTGRGASSMASAAHSAVASSRPLRPKQPEEWWYTTRTASAGKPRMCAACFRTSNGACEPECSVSLPFSYWPTAQEGPMVPCVCTPKRYSASSRRAAAGSAAAGSPRLTVVSARTTFALRAASYTSPMGGIGVPSLHSTFSSRAARTAFHSRSATTARRFFFRTTRAPGMLAMEDSSTDFGTAPMRGACSTRACSIPGSRTLWMKSPPPVTLSSTSGRGTSRPAIFQLAGSLTLAAGSIGSSKRLPPTNSA